jgi:hypothetical protein
MSELPNNPNLPTASPMPTSNNDGPFSSSKNTIVIIILVFVVLALIGVNLLSATGNAIDTLNAMLAPTIKQVSSMLGYSAGELINTTTDVAADVAKTSVDIAKGTGHSIGNLLKDGSKGGMDESQRHALEQALKSPKCPESKQCEVDSRRKDEPQPVKTTEPTVAPISSQKAKAGWCYVGDIANTRGCVEMGEHNKCMSGQVFPSQTACLKNEK